MAVQKAAANPHIIEAEFTDEEWELLEAFASEQG
jgi:hypothetical protein